MLCHARERYQAPGRPWTIFALVLGFALGGLLLLTGSLLAPILAHFTINYFNLHQIEGLRVGSRE